MKIIVKTQEEKDQLIAASEYLHYLKNIDTDIPMINSICHIYLYPEMIEIQNNE